MPRRRRSLLLVTLAALAALGACKPRVRVPSDLRDVPDEEEDEDWKSGCELRGSPHYGHGRECPSLTHQCPAPGVGRDQGQSTAL
eukprot:scaffold928_cov370-Prasinococcus_capsulatus_cf.AAC.10